MLVAFAGGLRLSAAVGCAAILVVAGPTFDAHAKSEHREARSGRHSTRQHTHGRDSGLRRHEARKHEARKHEARKHEARKHEARKLHRDHARQATGAGLHAAKPTGQLAQQHAIRQPKSTRSRTGRTGTVPSLGAGRAGIRETPPGRAPAATDLVARPTAASPHASASRPIAQLGGGLAAPGTSGPITRRESGVAPGPSTHPQRTQTAPSKPHRLRTYDTIENVGPIGAETSPLLLAILLFTAFGVGVIVLGAGYRGRRT
ncbi:MAG: hypothetical protein M3070_00250 [Actinomycetota bacterium]|nr:hypothetical protein [Actinomycetota bacterium]